MKRLQTLTVIFISLWSIALHSTEMQYKPARVVYDVSSHHAEELKNILDRASFLQRVYGNDPFESSIVIIIHEHAIPFFTNGKKNINKEFNDRASSLTAGEIIQFRVCQASAKMQGFTGKDFDDYIKLVPMADAEIVKLQNAGYAYLK